MKLIVVLIGLLTALGEIAVGIAIIAIVIHFVAKFW
jgi:hypothetical protein